MIWQIPPKIKIHEALGCISDNRIEISGNEAKVFSSSRGKYYNVTYDSATNSIMANDNGSYWKNYLGYPSIAFLMIKGIISYNQNFAQAVKGIPWKDLNVKFKNNFEETEKFISKQIISNGFSIEDFNKEVDRIYSQIKSLNINLLGKKTLPPKGY